VQQVAVKENRLAWARLDDHAAAGCDFSRSVTRAPRRANW
jgi:hypothetical protein